MKMAPTTPEPQTCEPNSLASGPTARATTVGLPLTRMMVLPLAGSLRPSMSIASPTSASNRAENGDRENATRRRARRSHGTPMLPPVPAARKKNSQPGRDRPASAERQSPMDITQLILDDHHEQRRLFAILEQIDRGDAKALAAIWARLSAFLEVHAEAEERHFYPALLRVGAGAGGKKSADDETEDAIKDHNEIRDAVAEVGRHDVGSKPWFVAVAGANKANSEHMGEEEREG